MLRYFRRVRLIPRQRGRQAEPLPELEDIAWYAHAEEAERMKAFWRERVAALKEVLEG
jgi:ATP-binding cassette subfamily B protein/ATP-binding cassette subfamily C protein